MIVDLTEKEIEIIETGIFVAQVECQLPETYESEDIQNLFKKLGGMEDN